MNNDLLFGGEGPIFNWSVLKTMTIPLTFDKYLLLSNPDELRPIIEALHSIKEVELVLSNASEKLHNSLSEKGLLKYFNLIEEHSNNYVIDCFSVNPLFYTLHTANSEFHFDILKLGEPHSGSTTPINVYLKKCGIPEQYHNELLLVFEKSREQIGKKINALQEKRRTKSILYEKILKYSVTKYVIEKLGDNEEHVGYLSKFDGMWRQFTNEINELTQSYSTESNAKENLGLLDSLDSIQATDKPVKGRVLPVKVTFEINRRDYENNLQPLPESRQKPPPPPIDRGNPNTSYRMF